MGDWEVDHGRPDSREDQPGGELGTIGDCAGDQGYGDDREHGLEGHESHWGQACSGVLHQALEAQVLGGIAEQAVADVVPECERVAVKNPEDGDQGQRPKAHHHHVEDALRPDHAAVEERQAWCHEQHQRA